MLQSLAVNHHLRWVLGRMVGRFWPLVAFSAVFSLAEAAILSPIAAGVVRLALDTWGRGPVGNFEIAAFVLSAPGLVGLLVLGAVQLTTLNLRLAGLMEVLAGEGPGARYALRIVRFVPTLLGLGFRQIAAYGLLAVPFLAAGWVAYVTLWKPHDLYRLVVTRPPEFWYGAAAVVVLGGGYAVVAGRLFLRWLFAVPAVLFERGSDAPTALRSSTERTRDQIGALALLFATCAVVAGGVLVAVAWALGVASKWVLDGVGESLTTVIATTAVVLAVDAIILAVLSALIAALFAGAILSRYRLLGGTTGVPTMPTGREQWWGARAGVIACGVLAVAGIATGWKLVSDSNRAEAVEITAHRAGSKEAPENTLAALRRAIAIGADWAEIDVQLTADGHVVVVHDTDLMRVGGSPLRVGRSTLEQLREVDVGSHFSPAFAGERLPTLDEYLGVAGDAIRLNIELKLNSRADEVPLTERVVAAIRSAGGVGRNRVCSQSLPAIRLVKRQEPAIEIGFITAASIGDLTRLDVDYLMVETRLAARRLIDRAALREMPVHAWTVNDPDLLAPLIDRGVANVITSDPSVMLARREEIRRLDPVERLLLRVRNALADGF